MTISVMTPPAPLPIFDSALPDRSFHTFADNVAYSGCSGLLCKQKANILLLWYHHKGSTKGWQVGAMGDNMVPTSDRKTSLALHSVGTLAAAPFLALDQKLTKLVWHTRENRLCLAFQLLDCDIVLINNHLETPGHQSLINVAPLLQSPDSQTSRVKSDPKQSI